MKGIQCWETTNIVVKAALVFPRIKMEKRIVYFAYIV